MRDKQGRFTKGNNMASKGGQARAAALSPARRRQIASAGWAGLVANHFAGDVDAAKTWIGRIGAWADDQRHPYWMRRYSPHPGSPGEFLARWRAWQRRAERLTNGTEVNFQ